MRDIEANKLIMMLAYNFAGFLPADPNGAAIKKGLWMDELMKHDTRRGEEAVKKLIQLQHYPPQIADFREALGPAPMKDKPALTGPVFGTKEGYEAMFTADPDHVNEVMEKLMRDL